MYVCVCVCFFYCSTAMEGSAFMAINHIFSDFLIHGFPNVALFSSYTIIFHHVNPYIEITTVIYDSYFHSPQMSS